MLPSHPYCHDYPAARSRPAGELCTRSLAHRWLASCRVLEYNTCCLYDKLLVRLTIIQAVLDAGRIVERS
jgi:hypothetical protein